MGIYNVTGLNKGTWVEVGNKKTRNQMLGKMSIWKNNKGKVIDLDWKEASSFFFTEFPDSFDARKMYDIFKDYGFVLEVFIPRRLDIRGKRFGFVRFKKVDDEDLMAINLDNIVINGTKIFANLPRFRREHKTDGELPYKKNWNQAKEFVGGLHSKPLVSCKMDKGVSFAQIAKGVRSSSGAKAILNQCLMGNKPTFAHLSFIVNKEDLERFEQAFTGVLEIPGSAAEVLDAFQIEGFFNIKITPMGANLCLLEEDNSGDIQKLITEDSRWISKWFSEICPWSPNDVDQERLTWVKIFGLPCHVWGAKIFKFLASTTAEFIKMDEETRKHLRFDVARILIRTKFAMSLNEVVNIDVNDMVYRIKIVEDSFGPYNRDQGIAKVSCFDEDSSMFSSYSQLQ